MNGFVRRAWYLAAWSSEVAERPLTRRILGDDIALYRDGTGGVHAIGAACPHRGADLGKGRVVNGALQCPFHGWRFDATGTCVRIPSQPESVKVPRTACVPAYPLVEKQGCLWIWPERNGAPSEEAPSYEMFEPRSDHGVLRYGPDRLESHFVNVIDNAFDESHLYFLHRKTTGIGLPIVPRQKVTRDEDGRGITTRWDPDSPWGNELFEDYDHPRGFLGRWLQRRYGNVRHFERTWQFHLGGNVYYRYVFESGTLQCVLGAATPIDEHHTWFATAFMHPALASPLARVVGRSLGRALNAEDRTGTVELLRKAPEFPNPISVAADEGALLFRRMYADALRAESSGSEETSRVHEVA